MYRAVIGPCLVSLRSESLEYGVKVWVTTHSQPNLLLLLLLLLSLRRRRRQPLIGC